MKNQTIAIHRRTQIRVIFYSSILVLLLFQGGIARADDFDGLFQRGMTLYQKRDFEAAIEAFRAAYKVRQFPRVLLNIAQVYRKMGNAQQALDYYQQFMKAEPKPPPKIKFDVEQYIAQTKAMLEATSLQSEEDRRREPAPNGFDKQTGKMLPWYTEYREAQSSRKKKLLIGIISGTIAAGAVIGIGLGVGLHYRNKLPDGLTIFEY